MPRVIEVIQSTILRGDGDKEILREVTQYHTKDGELLAEDDPCGAELARQQLLVDIGYPMHLKEKMTGEES